MATQNAELVLTAQKSIDGKQYRVVGLQHLPYTNAAQFLSSILSTRRHVGQIGYIAGSGDLIEIWQFQGGITDDKFVKILPQSVSSVTADNGLTLASGNIKLGGPLTANTTVNTGTFSMIFTGTAAAIVSGISTGNSDGVYGESGDGNGIRGIATAGGQGVFGTSSAGVGGAFSGGTYGLVANKQGSTNNVVTEAHVFRNLVSGTTAAGFGMEIGLYLATATTTYSQSNSFITKWTDAAFATRSSTLQIAGFNNGSKNIVLEITGAGLFTLTQGLTDYADDAAAAAGTPAVPVRGLYRTGSIIKMRVS